VCKRWSWWEVELVNVSYYIPIPYFFLRQDAAIAWTTFYGVAGLKSLANHWLRLYHTHKVWYRGTDKDLIKYGKTHEWFTDYSTSELVTGCVKVDTLGTPCMADLDWVPNHFIYFYITDKLYFYFLISFWYPHFLLLPTNLLVCNWELSLPLLLACHSKYLFCLFQH